MKKIIDSCFYCDKDQKLKDLMIKIEDLQVSTLYLNKDQTHFGRSILAFQSHKRELFELSQIELHRFMEDLAKGAYAIQEAFRPQKINYAIFGDLVSHLHIHIVPKYKEGNNWGEAFVNAPTHKKVLNGIEYIQLIEKINKHLKNEEDNNE